MTDAHADYLANLDMKTPQGVAWNIVVTMIEFPDGVEIDGHGWYESCAIRIADLIREMKQLPSLVVYAWYLVLTVVPGALLWWRYKNLRV